MSEIEFTHTIIWTEGALAAMCAEMAAAGTFVIDTETTGVDSHKDQLVSLVFASNASHAYYVPIAHEYPGCPEQLPLDVVMEHTRSLVEKRTYRRIAANCAFDYHILRNAGYGVHEYWWDTMIVGGLLESNRPKNAEMMASRYFLLEGLTSFKEMMAEQKQACQAYKKEGQETWPVTRAMKDIEIERGAKYACKDGVIEYAMAAYQYQFLKRSPVEMQRWMDYERHVRMMLSVMEEEGMHLDLANYHRIKQGKAIARTQALEDVAAYLKKMDPEGRLGIDTDDPEEVSRLMGSTPLKQLLLFEITNHTPTLLTPKEKPSTSKAALAKLEEEQDSELARLMRVYSEANSAITTVESAIKSAIAYQGKEEVTTGTVRVNTNLNQVGTESGRLSSTQPNLQNISNAVYRFIDGEELKIRNLFRAPDGYRLLSIDYSQLELRLLAHRSQCPGLMDAYSDPRVDLHQDTAIRVFGVDPKTDPENVVYEARRSAKTINFGVIYGRTAYGISDQLGISQEEAQDYLDLWMATYPGVVRYMAETAQYVRQEGAIITHYGRIRRLPNIWNQGDRYDSRYKSPKSAVRASWNHQIQGAASEVTHFGNMAAMDVIRTRGWDVRPCLQIHDEVLFYVQEHLDIDEVVGTLREAMEDPIPCRIPLVVDAAYGAYWGEVG